MLFIIIFLFSLFQNINTYDLCIAGASSGLGRELIYQGLDKKNKIIGLTNKEEIKIPFRGNTLSEKNTDQYICSKNLKLYKYYDNIPEYESLILTMGGSAFEKDDYSDKVTEYLIENLPKKCKNVILISAYGVGDSIKGANLGIVSMRNWYLKDVYRAKEEQEKIINNLNDNINVKIYRPKVLSYGGNAFDSLSRENLANEILTNIKIES